MKVIPLLWYVWGSHDFISLMLTIEGNTANHLVSLCFMWCSNHYLFAPSKKHSLTAENNSNHCSQRHFWELKMGPEVRKAWLWRSQSLSVSVIIISLLTWWWEAAVCKQVTGLWPSHLCSLSSLHVKTNNVACRTNADQRDTHQLKKLSNCCFGDGQNITSHLTFPLLSLSFCLPPSQSGSHLHCP